jgi:methyl-accepting chemotaxis protein
LAVLAVILVAGVGIYLLIDGSSGSNSASNAAGTQVPPSTTTQTQTTAKQNPKSHQRKRKTSVEGAAALDAALVAHPVVVVSVYARNVVTDNEAMQEAKAGAAEVGAGFVAFNVYDEKLARQLGDLLGGSSQVANPAVLFFKRPRKLAFELQGFADSQVVAQAAHNVYPYEEPWVSEANKACGRFTAPLATAMTKSKSANINTAAGRSKTAAALDEVIALLNQVTKSLSAVRTNVSAAKDYAQFVSDLQQLATDMSSEAAALRRNDLTTTKAILQKEVTLAETASSLATNLQITSCAP